MERLLTILGALTVVVLALTEQFGALPGTVVAFAAAAWILDSPEGAQPQAVRHDEHRGERHPRRRSSGLRP